ncbi:putative oligopeptide transporter, OPT superfamily [Dioscorea sansibarensis]
MSLLTKAFPENKFLKLINIHDILGGAFALPTTKTVNYSSWFTVGIAFNFFVYRGYKAWWARHNYLLSTTLDADIAFMGVVSFFTLQSYSIYRLKWLGGVARDHCDLASCPTSPGIIVRGCPTFKS